MNLGAQTTDQTLVTGKNTLIVTVKNAGDVPAVTTGARRGMIDISVANIAPPNGTAGAGTNSTQLQLAAGTPEETTADFYVGQTIEFTGGPGAGESAVVTGQTASGLLTFAALAIAPVAGSTMYQFADPNMIQIPFRTNLAPGKTTHLRIVFLGSALKATVTPSVASGPVKLNVDVSLFGDSNSSDNSSVTGSLNP
jgi:hypothetical protein